MYQTTKPKRMRWIEWQQNGLVIRTIVTFSQLREELEFKYDESEQSNKFDGYKRSACQDKRHYSGNLIPIFHDKVFLIKTVLI